MWVYSAIGLPNPLARIPTASSIAPSQAGRGLPQAGGGSTAIQLFVASAEGSSNLPAFDPASYSQFLAGPAHSPYPTNYTTSDELHQAHSHFQYTDATNTSLTPASTMTMEEASKKLLKQQRAINKKEKITVASSKAIQEMLSPQPNPKP